MPPQSPASLPTLEELNARGEGRLPGLIGVRFTHVEPRLLRSELTVRDELLAPNGFLHAASIIALADTTCGYGTRLLLPEGAENFTTIELKSNHLGTTQVWDAEVRNAEGRVMALFRCTQAVLYPKG